MIKIWNNESKGKNITNTNIDVHAGKL